MPMTPEQLREQLSVIEPDESTYAGIGPDEVPALRELLDDDEGWLAGRAAFALARVATPEAAEALREAGAGGRPEVRTAVAASADRLPAELADPVLATLLEDPSPAVRKFAVRSVSAANDTGVREIVTRLAEADDNPVVRADARYRVDQIGG